jgi:uncharacterized surface protein with fasciclin (FAS1) repeats
MARSKRRKRETIMLKSLLSASVLAIVAGSAFANPDVGGAMMSADMTIVENAVNSPIHTTLVAAVMAAGLVDTLNSAGPFTVFAPVNDAFAALPAGTVESLLLPENLATLQKILTCHVVAAEAFSTDLVSMIEADGGTHAITTVGGCVLQASIVDGVVMLMDEQGRSAAVTIADVDQSNGVIHVIDDVLLPAM